MNQEETTKYLHKLAGESAILRKSVVEQLSEKIFDLSALISGVIATGGKILLAGNGGSAADAQHFAGEMIVRLSSERNRQSLPALSLTADTAVLTATANDYGFDRIFSRQIEGLGNQGDMLIVISTSGNSQNLVNAVSIAKEKGLRTAALLGGNGGKLGGMVEQSLIVPHPSTQRIQEEQIFLIHILVELVESDLIK